MSKANLMKAPTARHHISLGQRPRIWEKKDHSPVGAGNFRAAPPEMGRPYRANSSVFVSPRSLSDLAHFCQILRFLGVQITFTKNKKPVYAILGSRHVKQMHESDRLLGQRPRTHEYSGISPVGATHFRRCCTEIARPYRAVVFPLPNLGALP